MTPTAAGAPFTRTSRLARLEGLLRERILVLDGAMGTMLQRYQLTEEDFRGARFADHPRDLRGNSDLLCLTQPAIVRDIHAAYLAAGADIVSTNSFTATRIAQADYGLSDIAGEINEAAARLAREAADEAEAGDGQPRYVGGSVGPTNRTASISPDVNDPAARNVTFPELVAAYRESAEGLIAGGADILLVETIFDTLNAKAAIVGLEEAFEATGVRLPLVISGTITDASGRTLERPDGRGVLGEHPPREAAARRAQLRARGEAAPRARRGAGPDRGRAARRLPQRRAAQRARRLRRDAAGHRDRARRVGAGRPRQRRGVVLRVHARAHARDRGRGRGHRAAGDPRGPAGDARCPASSRSSIPMPGGAFVNIGERTNVTGLARVRAR